MGGPQNRRAPIFFRAARMMGQSAAPRHSSCEDCAIEHFASQTMSPTTLGQRRTLELNIQSPDGEALRGDNSVSGLNELIIFCRDICCGSFAGLSSGLRLQST